MWLVPDYKMLNFAAKRFRKRAQQAALAKVVFFIKTDNDNVNLIYTNYRIHQLRVTTAMLVQVAKLRSLIYIL